MAESLREKRSWLLCPSVNCTATRNRALNYNANGDRTASTDSVGGAQTTYRCDQADRLTSFTKGSSTSTYASNGDGLRASKTVSGKTSTMTWNLAEGMPLLLGDGTNSYLCGAGWSALLSSETGWCEKEAVCRSAKPMWSWWEPESPALPLPGSSHDAAFG